MVRKPCLISAFTAFLAFCLPEAAGRNPVAVYAPSFHTLQVTAADNDMAPAVIRLGSDDRVAISFDEIASEPRYLRYELIHCDADWNPDLLMASEYLPDGFNEAPVDDYEYSRATTAHYVNYRITLPDSRMNPVLSGNYPVRVYDESEPDSTLLTAGFSIVEPLARIEADVTGRTDIDRNAAHQQLSLAVETAGSEVSAPATDLIVKIRQNNRTDNEITLTSPSSLRGTQAIYEHMPQLIFPGGKEYRRFETVNLRFPGQGVESYLYATPFYHATLNPDAPRKDTPYSYDSTRQGRFRVRASATAAPRTEADYVLTHFTLRMPEMMDADVYVEGDLTLRRFDQASRMVYNHAAGQYECTLLLKQGAYNYCYLALPRDAAEALTGPVEGDSHATVNEYAVSVYHNPPGGRYQRLIGMATVTAGR